MEKSGRTEPDSNEVAAAATTAAATGNGGIKESAPAADSVVQQSYKPLPDDDVNWQARNNASGESEKKDSEAAATSTPTPAATMGKQNGSTDLEHDDGAQERMLKDEAKTPTVVPSNKDASEVG